MAAIAAESVDSCRARAVATVGFAPHYRRSWRSTRSSEPDIRRGPLFRRFRPAPMWGGAIERGRSSGVRLPPDRIPGARFVWVGLHAAAWSVWAWRRRSGPARRDIADRVAEPMLLRKTEW